VPTEWAGFQQHVRVMSTCCQCRGKLQRARSQRTLPTYNASTSFNAITRAGTSLDTISAAATTSGLTSYTDQHHPGSCLTLAVIRFEGQHLVTIPLGFSHITLRRSPLLGMPFLLVYLRALCCFTSPWRRHGICAVGTAPFV
jgi:hypothetical protein